MLTTPIVHRSKCLQPSCLSLSFYIITAVCTNVPSCLKKFHQQVASVKISTLSEDIMRCMHRERHDCRHNLGQSSQRMCTGSDGFHSWYLCRVCGFYCTVSCVCTRASHSLTSRIFLLSISVAVTPNLRKAKNNCKAQWYVSNFEKRSSSEQSLLRIMYLFLKLQK